jgi:hypothetical protein
MLPHVNSPHDGLAHIGRPPVVRRRSANGVPRRAESGDHETGGKIENIDRTSDDEGRENVCEIATGRGESRPVAIVKKKDQAKGR